MQAHYCHRWPTASRPRRSTGEQQRRFHAAFHSGERSLSHPASTRNYIIRQHFHGIQPSSKQKDSVDQLSWDAATYDTIGPAFQATLVMLEWSKLCEQVARFASTHAGKRACRALHVPENPRETLRLLEQTR